MLIAAIALLALAFLVVLGPLIFRTTLVYVPWIEPLEAHFNVARFVLATAVITATLMILHKWLPAGRRRLTQIWPGILATIALWLGCGVAFGRYLADFAGNYVTYYAGLASAMIALVFLYFSAWIFIYGGELNAAIERARAGRAVVRAARPREKRGPSARANLWIPAFAGMSGGE